MAGDQMVLLLDILEYLPQCSHGSILDDTAETKPPEVTDKLHNPAGFSKDTINILESLGVHSFPLFLVATCLKLIPGRSFQFVRDNRDQLTKDNRWNAAALETDILQLAGGPFQEEVGRNLATLLDVIIKDKLTREMLTP